MLRVGLWLGLGLGFGFGFGLGWSTVMRQIEASAYLSAGTVSAVHASLHAVHFCSTPDSACAQQPVRRVRSASGRECGQEQHAGESWRSAQSSRTWRPSKEIRCACMGHAGGQVWEWRRAGGMCRRCGGEGRDAAARSGDAVLPRTGAVNLAGWSRRNTHGGELDIELVTWCSPGGPTPLINVNVTALFIILEE